MDKPHAKRSKSSEALMPNYILEKTLGIGSFGKVKLAHHALTGNKVAVKILNLQKLKDKDVERVRREIQVLGTFSHPQIIRLYEVIEMNSKIYLVMEYMNCGELYDYIILRGRLQEDEARYVFQQIISGVEFCHLNMVAHRDLKPENLLVDSKCNVKLADFGLSNVMRDGHFLKTACGSPNYAAPEILSGKQYAGPEVDVWSCGVILYALLCGRLPFDAESIPILYKQIKDGLYTLPSHLSPGARDLIPRILVVDPMNRITISLIRKHPWFQTHLPRHLAVPADEIRKRVNKIDDDILREVVDLGFDHNSVIEALRNRTQNEATVIYYLLLDKRFHVCNAYLDYGLQEESEHGTSNSHQWESTSLLMMNHPQNQLYTENLRTSLRLQTPIRNNWTVGLQSPSHPHEIMREVVTVLQKLNISWKKIGQYNMKCRWIPNFLSTPKAKALDLNSLPSNESSTEDISGIDLPTQNTIKFEIQLYKSSANRYLLDLQRVGGPSILFLEVCHLFLSQLQIM